MSESTTFSTLAYTPLAFTWLFCFSSFNHHVDGSGLCLFNFLSGRAEQSWSVSADGRVNPDIEGHGKCGGFSAGSVIEVWHNREKKELEFTVDGKHIQKVRICHSCIDDSCNVLYAHSYNAQMIAVKLRLR